MRSVRGPGVIGELDAVAELVTAVDGKQLGVAWQLSFSVWLPCFSASSLLYLILLSESWWCRNGLWPLPVFPGTCQSTKRHLPSNLNLLVNALQPAQQMSPYIRARLSLTWEPPFVFPSLSWAFFLQVPGTPCSTLQYLGFPLSQSARLFVETRHRHQGLAAGKALSLSLGLDRQPTSLAVKTQSVWSQDVGFLAAPASFLHSVAGIAHDPR
ncbi:hypothetical protein HDV57DRAFT_196191 [Trichoderma longibrachiatum]|uniref:Uncharacterized protein n=1 Tax=Trichoderma longibrachiatum ATCC 18648 TaxID=983965 RepID=A0A2T4C8N4_TRILO|nr:hypothetical protein M440DRAFT_295430 [Trichoderma longibrachiatum ATCC 18648]